MSEKTWKLSPSDFGFLWNECKKCFYLKVARGYPRPFGAFPKIFGVIDSAMKEYFEGKEISAIVPELPRGIVQAGEKKVESTPIEVPGHDGKCYIYGNFDTVVKFEAGGWGVIDFKTSETKPEKARLYSAQLHAYAYALENPAPGKPRLAPVTRLGLLCVEPFAMDRSPDNLYLYQTRPAWIEIKRDDESFMKLLGEVLDVLSLKEPPKSGDRCPYCAYRDKARETGL